MSVKGADMIVLPAIKMKLTSTISELNCMKCLPSALSPAAVS